MGDIEDVKDKLVDKMESNDFDSNDPDLRRGSNVIQGLMSNKKRRLNRIPRTPVGLKQILEGIPGDEDNTEGSDSDSPAYNPTSPPSTMESVESYATSPPSTVQTTESSGTARTQGPRMILEFTPVPKQEPAVDFESEERTDMSMFIALFMTTGTPSSADMNPMGQSTSMRSFLAIFVDSYGACTSF